MYAGTWIDYSSLGIINPSFEECKTWFLLFRHIRIAARSVSPRLRCDSNVKKSHGGVGIERTQYKHSKRILRKPIYTRTREVETRIIRGRWMQKRDGYK